MVFQGVGLFSFCNTNSNVILISVKIEEGNNYQNAFLIDFIVLQRDLIR